MRDANVDEFSILLTYLSRLECCAPFIKAIAEGLRERTGLAVSILLAGPVPKNDGEIGLRRCVSQLIH